MSLFSLEIRGANGQMRAYAGMLRPRGQCPYDMSEICPRCARRVTGSERADKCWEQGHFDLPLYVVEEEADE